MTDGNAIAGSIGIFIVIIVIFIIIIIIANIKCTVRECIIYGSLWFNRCKCGNFKVENRRELSLGRGGPSRWERK